MTKCSVKFAILSLLIFSIFIGSCRKIEELTDDNPDIAPLKEGFKTSAALGFCASLAVSVLSGEQMPDYVTFSRTSVSEYSNSGIIYVNTSRAYPLPFNKQIGQIVIAGLWDGDDGLITVSFSDVDLFDGRFRFYGIHTIPVMRDKENGSIITAFAKQDIVIGEGNDTLLNLNFSKPQFSKELLRLEEEQPQDAFIAASQNIWFININQNGTPDVYDDSYIVNGGGQIAEASSNSGGISYHALIETRFNWSSCSLNPTNGTGFIQKLKAGESSIDLGNIYLDFHDNCDGKAYVNFSAGEYLKYIRRNVNLNFE